MSLVAFFSFMLSGAAITISIFVIVSVIKLRRDRIRLEKKLYGTKALPASLVRRTRNCLKRLDDIPLGQKIK